MRPSAAQGTAANALLSDLRDAGEALRSCLDDLEKVLARPVFDAGALTSVRLRLAGLRLTRGPIIARVSELLSGNVTQAQETMLAELRTSHQQLLQSAAAHTAKWTLDAIERNWLEYRRETRALVRKWLAKAEHEGRLLFPLVQKCVHSRQE